MALTPKMLDELVGDCKTPQDVEKLYSQMLQHMINRSLEAEMQAHLGHERHRPTGAGNPRNGKGRKTVQSAVGDLGIETPRDRDCSFEPQLVKKRQVRLAGMEDKILTLYAKGMTTRDIESALVDLYGVTISHSLIAQVTDAVLDEARAWQTRPPEAIYPIVWLDGIVVKVQQHKQVIKKSAHVVLGVNLRGEKEVLGLWLAGNEGAKFWLAVLTELRQRGVQDIYVASMDGLKGLARGGERRVPEDADAVVHRAPGASQPALRGRPGQQGGGPAHLPLGDRRGGAPGAGRAGGRMGRQVSVRGLTVARQLGQHHSLLPVLARDPQGDLHDQRERVVEYEPAQTHPQPAHLPERRFGAEVAVPGDSGSLEELEIDPSLEASAAKLPADVRRRARALGGTVMNSVTQLV